ncbi:MAG: hypothetical protein ACM3JB_19780 [Acidobacteriaceae bacterium]
MQTSRYQPGGNVAICVWCESEFSSANSRAHENGIFCTKKCEIEAKFWLLDRLKKQATPDTGESAGI